MTPPDRLDDTTQLLAELKKGHTVTTDMQAPPIKPDAEPTPDRLVNGRFNAEHAGDLAAVRMRSLFRRPAPRRVLDDGGETPVVDLRVPEEVTRWR